MPLVAPDTTQSLAHLLVIGTAKNQPGWADISAGVQSEIRAAERVFLDRLGYDRSTYRQILNPTRDLRVLVSTWCRSIPVTGDDVVVVYYTGHGVDVGSLLHLITSDVPSDQPELADTAQQLVMWILKSRPTPFAGVLLILDTCHSGVAQLDVAQAEARLREWSGGDSRATAFHAIASTRSIDVAGVGDFMGALERVIRDQLAGTGDDEWLSPDAVIDRVNVLLSTQGDQRAAFSGHTERHLRYFPNPYWSPRLRMGMDPIQARHALHRIQVTALRTHWDPRARGVAVASEGGWFFTGRSDVLKQLIAWISNGNARGGLVVAGPPGSGKSAVLARLVTLSEPAVAARARPAGALEDIPAEELPAADIVDVAVHARSKSVSDIALEIFVTLGGSTKSDDRDATAALSTMIQKRAAPTIIVVDALDEAKEPLEAAALLRSIVDVAQHARVVAGVRADRSRPSPVLPPLGDQFRVLELSADAATERADMQRYVERYLLAQPGSPYAPPEQSAYVKQIAAHVAERAGRSFLVASATARALAARGAIVERGELSHFPTDVGAAFDFDFDLLLEHLQMQATIVFGALAFARGHGLPRSLWLPLASALGSRRLIASDLDYWLTRAGYYVTDDAEMGSPVVRLYHEEFASYLREKVGRLVGAVGRGTPGDIVTQVLEDTAPADDVTGRRNWRRASSYALAYLPASLMDTGALEKLYALVQDPDFIDGKRRRFGDLPPVLEDLRLAIYSARTKSPIDVETIVRCCVIFSRLMSTAPPMIVDVLAAVGQPGRATLIAQNITYPLDRSAAFCHLTERAAAAGNQTIAQGHLEVAQRAAEDVRGSYGTMARYWLVRAALARLSHF